MFKTIEGAADCEIRPVIRVLNARNVLPSEVLHQICQVYGDNAMSDGMVRKFVGMFNEGRENVHDAARSGRPSLVIGDLVRKVNERVLDDRRFTVSDLCLHFPQISRILLCALFSSGLHCRRPHSLRMVCKSLCPSMISASIFLIFLVCFVASFKLSFAYSLLVDRVYICSCLVCVVILCVFVVLCVHCCFFSL